MIQESASLKVTTSLTMESTKVCARTRKLARILATTAAVSLVPIHPSGLSAQVSPCRGTSNISTQALYSLKQMWGSNGADSAAISIVTDSASCQAVINAYNTQSAPGMHVDSGYVFKDSLSFMLYLPSEVGTLNTTELTVIFDAELKIQVRMAGLH